MDTSIREFASVALKYTAAVITMVVVTGVSVQLQETHPVQAEANRFMLFTCGPIVAGALYGIGWWLGQKPKYHQAD